MEAGSLVQNWRSFTNMADFIAFWHQIDMHGQLSDLLQGVSHACPAPRKFILVASMGKEESEDLTEVESYLKICSHKCTFSLIQKY